MSIFKNLVNKVAPKLAQIANFAKKQASSPVSKFPSLNNVVKTASTQATSLNGSLFSNSYFKTNASVKPFNQAAPNVKTPDFMSYAQQLQNEFGSQYAATLKMPEAAEEVKADSVPQTPEEVFDSKDLCRFLGCGSTDELKEIVADSGIIDFDKLENGGYSEYELQTIARDIQEAVFEQDDTQTEYIESAGLPESAGNQEAKSEAQEGADRLVQKLFGSVEIPAAINSYTAVATLSLDELNNKLGTNFSTKYATDATFKYAKNMHGIDKLIYVDSNNKEHEINSKDDLKKYQQNVPENPNEIPVGSIVIMDNPNGGNFHSGLLVGYTQDGKALVIEGNSDKANRGAAMVAYDFNSATEKSIKGYIPIKGLSDLAPQVEPDPVVDPADEPVNPVVNPVDDNTDVQDEQDDATISPVASDEQYGFKEGLAEAQQLEDSSKTKEFNGVVYHFDSEGKILYTVSSKNASTNEAAPVGISDSATVDAIKDNDMNLDIFCQKYSSQYDKANKAPYIEEVAKHITTTLAAKFMPDKPIVDAKGNYTPEIQSLYSQIYANNRELFEKSGYNLGDNPSVSQISETLAIFSWDGDKTKDGTAKIKNDHINLSGITIEEQKSDNLITLYEYNENGVSSVTQASISQEANNPNAIKCNPSDFELLSKESYDYTSTEGFVDVIEQDFQTGTTNKQSIASDTFQLQSEFASEIQIAKANAVKIETSSGITRYYDSNNNLIYTESKNPATGLKIVPVDSKPENGMITLYDKDGTELVRFNEADINENNCYVAKGNDQETYYYDEETGGWAKQQLYRYYCRELYDYDDAGRMLSHKTASVEYGKSNLSDGPTEYSLLSAESYEYDNEGGYTIHLKQYTGKNAGEYDITVSKEEMKRAQALKTEIEYAKASATPPSEALQNDPNVHVYGYYDENHRLICVGDDRLIKYDEQGRVSSIVSLSHVRNVYDESGRLVASVPLNELVVGIETRYTYNGDKVIEQKYNGDGTLIGEPRTIEINSNEQIEGDNLRQFNTGDCWLISSLISYSKTEGGQHAIDDAITRLDNGDFEVQLYAPIVNDEGKVIGYEDHKTPYIVTQTELFNIMILGGPYAVGDVDAIIIERAKEQQWEAATKEQFRLNGKPRYFANYGPNRPYCMSNNDNACELTYALFGEEGKTVNFSEKSNGKAVKKEVAKQSSIAWLKNNGADAFENGNVAIMFDTAGKSNFIENADGEQEQLIGGHAYSMTNCENVINNGKSDSLITLQETNSGVITKVYLSELESNDDFYFYVRYYDFN